MRSELNRWAFSLVECMIALSLVLIIVAFAIPHLSFLNNRLVRADLEKIAMTAAYLQRRALVSGRKQELRFDSENRHYITNEHVYQLADHVLFGTAPGAQGPPSAPVRAIQLPITFDRQRIIFYPDGKMQPGSVYLVDNEQRFAYALTVPISHISCIRKYYYNNGVWELVA